MELLGREIVYIFSLIISRLFGMNSFKSSPLIEDRIKPRCVRKSRRVSKPIVSKDPQVLIPNPFRQGEQQNYLPVDLKNQIDQLDYISPTQIQGICFTTASGARRSSAFARHLQVMQNAAKKQEEMYHYFSRCKPEKKQSSETDIMEEELPMTIEENDNLSTRMNQYFFMMDDDHMEQEPINFFQTEDDPEDIIFYSQNAIPAEEGYDFEAYFDV